MESCEFLEKCPIFNKFKVEGSKNFWISMFCQGTRKEECARGELKREGNEVPIDLLPNGSYLKSLDE